MLWLVTPESQLDERLIALANKTKSNARICDKLFINDGQDEPPMGKPTTNLTAPYALRLRHDQRVELHRIINSMSEDDIASLLAADRSKFEDPERYKARGQKPNPLILLVRAAVDTYLAQHPLTRDDQLSLFPDLDGGS